MHFHDHLSGYSERLHYWLETNSLFRISVSLWVIAKNRLENRDFIITILLLPPNPWIQYFAFRQHNLTHSVSRVAYVKLHEILQFLCRGIFSLKPTHLEEPTPSKSTVSRIIGPTKFREICNLESWDFETAASSNRFFE